MTRQLFGWLLAALLLGGCAATVPGLAVPAPLRGADSADPVDVIHDALTTMFGWRPTTDGSPADAYTRARPYLTEQLAARAGQDTGEGSQSQWEQWRDRGATITVTVEVTTEEHPPDQDARMDRVVLITQTIAYPGGGDSETIDMTVWTTVVRTEAGWRINAMQF